MLKYVKEVVIAIVATDYKWVNDEEPSIDVEFWRHGTYNDYENVSRKNFRNLTRALKDVHAERTSAEVNADVLTVSFKT